MILSYDSIVRGLMELGVSREHAEARARREVGMPAPIEQTRDEWILEKEEQTEVVKLFRSYGFNPRNLSQARASKQAPGICDLWVVHRTRPIAFWWETKRQVGGELSPAQIEFRDDCIRCHVGYGTGDRFAAAEHLVKLGLAERIGDRIEPARSAA